MKISIIIPVYNVEKYIKDCLESVCNQTYKNIEIVIVDDCGKDKSMLIVNEFISKHNGADYKIVKHNTNKGLSAARNSGIKASTGDYIFFLDADDTLYSNTIELFINKINLHTNVDIVAGTFNIISNNVKLDLAIRSEEYLDSNEKILSDYLLYKWDVTACNKLIKKDLISSNNIIFWEGMLHEDNDFTFRLAFHAKSMAFCYEPTYNYFIRNNSITSSKTDKHYLDYIRIFRNNIKILETSKYKNTLKYIISEYYIKTKYSICYHLCINNNITLKNKLIILRNFSDKKYYFNDINNRNLTIKKILLKFPLPAMVYTMKLINIIKKYKNHEHI